jgi:hypothetical protein
MQPTYTPTARAGKAAADRIFGQIPTRRGEQLRIALSNFKGATYLAIRVWFTDDDGEMKPTGKGVNIKVEHLPAIADAIGKALKAARADGLVP